MPDQASLFPEKRDDDFLQNQLIKLGDMMGDGLHHEPDGKWIEQDYRRIAKLLMPEVYSGQRKAKRGAVDVSMANLLKDRKCECSGVLVQSHKGCKTTVCMACGKKYVAVKKKK